MKRKFILGLVTAAVIFLLTAGILALLPGPDASRELSEKIDPEKALVLHFEECHIKLISWDGDEVRVKQGPLYGKDAELSYQDNTVTVLSGASKYNKRNVVTFQSQTWATLLLFDKYFDYAHEIWDQNYVDFYVYVPRGMSVESYTSGIMGSVNGVDYENH